MKLEEYIPNQTLLTEHLKSGVVEMRKHDFLPLRIWCYGRKATFDNVWDEVTCKTRGLITDVEGNIVARPFEKFFNLNDARDPRTNLLRLIDLPNPVFMDKPDGSMGTYWKYTWEGKTYHGIATKGSFHSEQAEWATKWLEKRCTSIPSSPVNQLNVHAWPARFTPVFEIIAQSVQHHVVHYLPKEDNRLVLLALVHIETGMEMEYTQLSVWASINGLDVVEQYEGLSLYGAMKADRDNKEGFIVKWTLPGYQPPFRVKIKHETFLKLQKIAHHTTPKTIFQALRSSDHTLIEEAVQYGSHFLRDAVKDWVRTFHNEYGSICGQARDIVQASLVCCTTRKESAAFFLGTSKRLAPVCFNILDQKDYKEAVWNLVEPLVKTIKYDEVEEEN